MNVTKRNGELEPVSFDEITKRLQQLCYGLSPLVDPIKVGIRVVEGLYEGVTTVNLDILSSEICASMTIVHPDYSLLASRVAVSNLHRNTNKTFSETMNDLHSYVNPKNKLHSPIISDETFRIVNEYPEFFDNLIDYNRDFNYDFFGFKTLERSYLLKINEVIAERPQDMLLRVSIGIHGEDLVAIAETYDLMSQKYFTHATPTLFNSGTPKPQLSSCFLLQMQDDSIEGIYDTLKQTAQISQSAGGIGLSIHNIRATGSYIRGTNGISNGIIPMLRVFNDTARYVDQGGGKRKGSFAIYIEPWHADIFDFLDLRKNTGKEEMRTRDLFLALWSNDLFMQRVESDLPWTLMCPNECPNLHEVYGEEFEALYTKYETEGKGKKTIPARELWEKILESQIETGTPYILHKDSANKKSNQKNLGTIKSSNLCTEIMEYTAKDEVAVCNLASLSLPMFVKDGAFDHENFFTVVKKVTKNLNRIIDINYYPIIEAKNSNMRHRPIGLGVQGLADLFIILRLPFTSVEAKKLNKEIFETLYFASLTSSMELAKIEGTYSTYKGSPISKGIFQHNMWGVDESELSGRWDWKALRNEIFQHGVRNSLLVAPMPTASTSQILGNNEAFEPYTSNIYTRRTLSGEFIVVNKFLLKDLIAIGLWDEDMKQTLMRENGSIQNIPTIPTELKELYRTVWEMSMKDIIDMSKERGYFVDQSQSLNLFVQDANYAKLTSMHFYAWKAGLKTGMYYLRTKSAVDAIKFTLNNDKKVETVAPIIEVAPIAVDDFKAMLERSKNAVEEDLDCVMCGS